MDRAVTGRGSAQAGFTLIEIIVAFTVTALVLGALYQLFSTGVRSGADAAAYDDAVLIAESTLDAFGILRPLAPGEVRDVVGGRFTRLTVVRARPDLADNAAGAATALSVLYQIDVEVTWTEARRTRSVSLTTLRVVPSVPPA